MPTWPQCSRCTRATTAIDGFVEDTSVAELATLGVPVVADIGSGLIDANCPWLGGPPPAWLHGEPAARQTLDDGAALVTFSGDKLFGGPQAGIIAGRADLVALCARHPLARALRPGAHVLAAVQHTALAYLDRTAVTTIPFWPMVAATTDDLQTRAGKIIAAAGVGEIETDAGDAGRRLGSRQHDAVGRHPHRRRSPGRRCGRAARRSSPAPATGRTLLDLRTVEPGSDDAVAAALRRCGSSPPPATSTTASRRWSRR